MFEQENFSTPRMHNSYHLEVVAMDYCFGIIKHRLMPKLGWPISVRLRGGLGYLHSPNDDSNYTYSQLVVTYTFPSHSQGIVQNLRSQEMTTCRQKLEDMEPTERKKRMFQTFGFGQ